MMPFKSNAYFFSLFIIVENVKKRHPWSDVAKGCLLSVFAEMCE